MDSEILAAERAADQAKKRRALTWYYTIVTVSTVVFFAVLSVLIFPDVGLAQTLILLGATAVVLVASGLVGLAFAKNLAKKANAKCTLASRGPWSFGQVYTKVPSDRVWADIQHTIARHGLKAVNYSETAIAATMPRSYVSSAVTFLIDLRPSVDHLGWGVVTVASRPKSAYLKEDFGNSQSSAQWFLASVPDHRPPGHPDLG